MAKISKPRIKKPVRDLVSVEGLQKKQESVALATDQASQQLDKHVIRRWGNVIAVRRHVMTWLLLVASIATGLFIQNRQLAAYYRQDDFVAGGSYSEGVVGDLTNINPIFAAGLVDSSLSRLVFAGLLKYDDSNRLVGDLAEGFSVDEKGTTYTVTLRKGLTWHDGKPLTSKDVVFTYKTIQHPDTRSPFNQSWQLIGVEAKDPQTVVFTLPVSLTAFPQSLTTGIIPEHILGKVEPAQLRSAPFNIKDAIGAGPFRIGEVISVGLTSKQINLLPFADYHTDKPKLDQLSVHTYPDQDDALQGFKNGEVQAVAGSSFIGAPDIGMVSANAMNVPLTNGVFAFFKTTSPLLSDAKLRQSLALGYDTDRLRSQTLKNTRLPLPGPLLQSQLVYGPDLQQKAPNKEEALKLIDAAGYKLDPSGNRVKDGKQVVLNLATQNTTEYSLVANDLQKQWAELGVKVHVDLLDESELQQNYITPHNYDILLYSIGLGVDADVYAYWHSREARLGGLNLSEYKSSNADASLEAGRTRNDPVVRVIKYKGFLQSWRDDVPAIALYQSSFDYLQTTGMKGYRPHAMVSPSDRFNNVSAWMTQQRIANL